MATKASMKRAAMQARVQANEILRVRSRALARRERALKLATHPSLRKRGVAKALPGASSVGTLVAEGDSWFDYPFYDVIKELEDGFAYEVECVAHRGDAIEEMAYTGGQLEELTRRLEKLLRQGTVPKAILLSGGGNDVAGDAFVMLLNHKESPIAGLNEKVLDGVIGERVQRAYARILDTVTHVANEKVGHAIPIVVHGYDYPVPDGRGFLGGWWILPGPWLEPGFRAKGFGDLRERTRIAKGLIDRFNTMLQATCAAPQYAHVHYLDLRDTLSTGPDYKNWWGNELHPTERGFAKIAAKFQSVLAAL